MRAEGVTAGVPDLFIAKACGHYHGLYIEMKNGKKGKVSEEQQKMMLRLESEGYKCEVTRSLEEFIGVVNNYFSCDVIDEWKIELTDNIHD